MTAEWYYVGNYGQIGPLTKDQIDELVRESVILADTFVWRQGMPDWVRANALPDLAGMFRSQNPPPVPLPPQIGSPMPMYGRVDPVLASLPRSDRQRWLAGLLQLLIPGVGRFYLGYPAHGILQLGLTPCIVGYLWSVIDGIVILAGGVRLDGMGRYMAE